MTRVAQTPLVTPQIATCPYCGEQTRVDLAPDYAPVFDFCDVCGAKFIAERLAEGFHLLTLESAPCSSDPDCRAIEIGASDEQ